MIDSAKLDRVVSLHSKDFYRDELGTEIVDFVAVATVRAQRIETTARDFLRAAGEGIEVNTVFRIRYRGDVDPDDLVVEGGRQFEIVEVIEIGRREGLELRCRARA